MELNDLKSTWQNAGDEIKSERDLARMTKVFNHPAVKKIRMKLVTEVISLAVFLFVYYDWFDGDQKPLIANVFLVGSVILYILNNIMGYIALVRPVSHGSIRASLAGYLARIKRLSMLSLSMAFVYGISIMLFFSMVITFTTTKFLILGGILMGLILLTYFSFRVWMRWIKNLRLQVQEFDDPSSFSAAE